MIRRTRALLRAIVLLVALAILPGCDVIGSTAGPTPPPAMGTLPPLPPTATLPPPLPGLIAPTTTLAGAAAADTPTTILVNPPVVTLPLTPASDTPVVLPTDAPAITPAQTPEATATYPPEPTFGPSTLPQETDHLPLDRPWIHMIYGSGCGGILLANDGQGGLLRLRPPVAR